MQAEQRVTEIETDSIILEDTCYRFTEQGNIEAFAESIRGAGLINPPVVQRRQENFRVVTGFRRTAACMYLKWRRMPCRVLAGDTDFLYCLKIAIADNALTRELNLGEKSGIVGKLQAVCDGPHSISALLESLGLFIAPPLVEKLSRVAVMPDSVRLGVACNYISLNVALALESAARDSAEAVAGLFADLRPTVNQQQEIFSGLNDLAGIKGLSISALLKKKYFSDILLCRDLDRGRKLKLFRLELYRRRYPALSRAEAEFYRRRQNLELEEGMELKPPANFEDTEYTIILKFSSEQQLSRQAEILHEICRHPDLKAIISREIEDTKSLY
ncbi:MAG: ParB N-terminal domain-containing protein [Desulfobacterales bacterium]|nr:ParB N-terminal domain-containing protein [Desulfobacterales bacterium]